VHAIIITTWGIIHVRAHQRLPACTLSSHRIRYCIKFRDVISGHVYNIIPFTTSDGIIYVPAGYCYYYNNRKLCFRIISGSRVHDVCTALSGRDNGYDNNNSTLASIQNCCETKPHDHYDGGESSTFAKRLVYDDRCNILIYGCTYMILSRVRHECYCNAPYRCFEDEVYRQRPMQCRAWP